ncbi:amino acid permease-domain-containing protein [Lasiosphaeria hispida]|uniref:Amino acid permease-domain-containing protein n=1 Tax=Lasiosphaeria hispida TaxID=260671 RepID=A0AAJ0MB88_9PEZI|nr:amino acid permease-domain-containing protein [Lasiosphaeria hispida]
MVGGQVLIIFVGSDAFKIYTLNGKEWGLSIGLGAISLPWGAHIPNIKIHILMPRHNRKHKAEGVDFEGATHRLISRHIAVSSVHLESKFGAGHRKVTDPETFKNAFSIEKGEGYGGGSAYEHSNALLNIVYSYKGWENANYVLGEIKDPRRTLTIAAPLAVGGATILYVLANVAYFAAIPKSELATSDAIVAGVFFKNVSGDSAGVRVLSVFVAPSNLGNVLAVSFAHARLNQELGKEGLGLPLSRFWGSNKPFNSPAAANIFNVQNPSTQTFRNQTTYATKQRKHTPPVLHKKKEPLCQTMDTFLHPPTFIIRRHPPSMEEQITQGLVNYALTLLLEDPREDARHDFPPLSDNDSSHSLIVRTNGVDLRVQDRNVAPQLLEQALVVARSAAEAHTLEAKSRAIRNIVVPVLAVAAFAFVAFRRSP